MGDEEGSQRIARGPQPRAGRHVPCRDARGRERAEGAQEGADAAPTPWLSQIQDRQPGSVRPGRFGSHTAADTIRGAARRYHQESAEWDRFEIVRGGTVDEDAFNMSVRKFLKTLGVTAQREIELTVREQLAAGELNGDEVLETTARVTVHGLPREVIVTGTIALS